METPGTRDSHSPSANPAEPRGERILSFIFEPTPLVIFAVGLLLERFGILIGLLLMIRPATAERLPLMGVICVMTGFTWFFTRMIHNLTVGRSRQP